MNNNEELESITEQFKKAALDSQDVEFIDMVQRNLVKANDNVEKWKNVRKLPPFL